MFWQLPHHDDNYPIWIYEGEVTTAIQLKEQLANIESNLQNLGRKTLGIIFCHNHPAAVMMYLATLRAGHVALLLPADMHQDLANKLIETYEVDWLFHPSGEVNAGFVSKKEFNGWNWHLKRQWQQSRDIHPNLALLLSTSGSTGSPKTVRLSYDNLASNAEAIAEYLDLNAQDRAITSLSISYSYGLSVLNSHLQVGASIALTDASMMQPEFWQIMQQKVTHLAGVPSQYQMLKRLKFETRVPKSLRILTQAGGKLEDDYVTYFAELAQEHDWQFFVMYGQTEATARIAYLPPEQAINNYDCIGQAILGGKLYADEETSELIYRGANVMMGYAESADDLSLGDECNGVLHTGDIGEQNAAGFWKITGRLKRFLKLAGKRTNLEEIEQYLKQRIQITCLCSGEDEHLKVWVVSDEDAELDAKIGNILFEYFGIHPTLVSVSFIADIPLTAHGKTDYQQLRATAV